MNKKMFRLLLGLALIVMIQILASFNQNTAGSENFNPISESHDNDSDKPLYPFGDQFICSNVYVIDGDTIKCDQSETQIKVRLLGINTPETKDPRKEVECFGQEASNKLKSLIEGNNVLLKVDKSANEYDVYGRLLAYVYTNDGLFINSSLIAEGYAFATPQYTFYFKDEFVNLEKAARLNNIGLWSEAYCNY